MSGRRFEANVAVVLLRWANLQDLEPIGESRTDATGQFMMPFPAGGLGPCVPGLERSPGYTACGGAGSAAGPAPDNTVYGDCGYATLFGRLTSPIVWLIALLFAGCGSGPNAAALATPTTSRMQTPESISTFQPSLPTATAPAEPTPMPSEPSEMPTRVPTDPLAVPPPQTFSPIPFRQDAALQALIEQVVGDEASSYGVYVKDLADGSGAALSSDRVYRSASLFKVYVMWEAFRQQALGLLSFDDLMEVTPYYKSFELGTDAVAVGDLISVRQALALMMSISDTPSAVLLQDSLGFENVNAGLEALGIYNSGLFYPGDPLAAARDLGVLLEAIAGGDVLPAESHQEMLALLSSEQTDNGLRAGVPADVPVAHKTGLLEMVQHDAGIVYAPRATYVLVVLWDRQSPTNLIETLSRAVYDYFETE